MRVHAIQLYQVTTHEETTLRLPERGVVLLTGGNGSGKSSLIEAVPLALWGKTLRGAPLWNGKAARVELELEGLSVLRTAGKRVKLSFARAGEEPVHYESTTEAQRGLDATLGLAYDQWRRFCVLSSSDASTFTSATDADRKRLIEALTSGEKLEAAYRLAREDLRQLDARVAEQRSKAAVLGERVRGAKLRIADALPVELEPVEQPDRGAYDRARAHEREAYAELAAQRRQAGGVVTQALAEARARAAEARKQALRLAADTCPTCSQPIPERLHASLEAEVQAAERVAAEQERAAAAQALELQQLLTELEEEHGALRERVLELEAGMRAWEAYESARKQAEHLDRTREAAAAELATAKGELAELQAAVAELEAELTVVRVSAKVLSTKGVRAHLLHQTIAAIEASANAWLDRICAGGFTLSLSPYGEKKDGSTKAGVSLAIERPGSSLGYASASGGERRRVDIALTFAIAEVAEAAMGRSGSTIFCDEMFDALDSQWVARVCDALRELAETRCVVVVAHSAAEQLRSVAVAHYEVRDGVLTSV